MQPINVKNVVTSRGKTGTVYYKVLDDNNQSYTTFDALIMETAGKTIHAEVVENNGFKNIKGFTLEGQPAVMQSVKNQPDTTRAAKEKAFDAAVSAVVAGTVKPADIEPFYHKCYKLLVDTPAPKAEPKPEPTPKEAEDELPPF